MTTTSSVQEKAPSETQTSNNDTKSSDDDDKEQAAAAIQKAIRFWNHPSLIHISTSDKIAYLRAEHHMTDDQLHKVWQRIADQPQESSASLSNPQQQQQQVPPATTQAPPPLTRMPPAVSNCNHALSSHHHHHPRQEPPPHQPPYQSQSYHHYPRYHPNEEEPQNVQGNAALLLTIGGMLGLGAAAAVRWLNGGDFSLLPPVLKEEQSTEPLERNPQDHVSQESEQIYHEQEYLDTENDDDDMMVPDETTSTLANPPLLEQIQELTMAFKSHVVAQERVLQKLSAQDQRQVTDKSMDLLRPSNEESTATQTSSTTAAVLWPLFAQLVELHAQFNSSTKDDTSDESESKLRIHVLQQLSSCIQAIQQEMGGKVNGEADAVLPLSEQHKSMSTDSSSSASSSCCGTTPVSRGKVTSSKDDDMVSQKAPQDDVSSTRSRMTLLRNAIDRLARDNDPAALRAGAQILYLYMLNLSSHPTVARYRKIYKSNDSYQRGVQDLHGAMDLLCAVGFQDKGTWLEWQNDDHQEEDVTMLLQQAAAALSILKSPQQQQQDSLNRNALAQAATAVLSCKDEDELNNNNNNTPLRPQTTILDESCQKDVVPGSKDDDDMLLLQTPQPNLLVSPPTTKKHTFLSSSGFPEAPLSLLDDHHDEEVMSTSLLDVSATSLEIRPYPSHGNDDEEEELLFSTNNLGFPQDPKEEKQGTVQETRGVEKQEQQEKEEEGEKESPISLSLSSLTSNNKKDDDGAKGTVEAPENFPEPEIESEA